MENTKKTSAFREKFTAFIIAVAFLFNSLCLLANILLPSITDFGEILVIGILLLGIIACISSVMRIYVKLLCINGVILVAMLLSFMFYDYAAEIRALIINFFVWGIGVTVIMMQRFDLRTFLNCAFWMATVVIVVDLLVGAHQDYDPMVWTYAVFPSSAVTVLHFAYCRFEKLLLRLAYIPAFLALLKFAMNANRGGFLSLFVLVFFISIKAVSKTNMQLKSKHMTLLVMTVVSLLLALFFNQLVVFFYNTLASYDIKIVAISKMYRLIAADNLTNNRDELYQFAWNGFLASPIWGNGVGGFSVNHGGWAHNFILQLLYEGGVLLSALVLVPLIRNSAFIIVGKRITPQEYAMFVLLFSTSIPRLLFSTELWNTQMFWMLFAFCMLVNGKYKTANGEF